MNRFGLPILGFGMGLRSPHYQTIFDTRPKVDWFEIISENFMDSDGPPREKLERILEHYPVVMHGVSMSIGSTDPLDRTYLRKLKALADWVNPPWISDHLCWTGVNKKNSHDLLPVPYTEASLKHVVGRIKKVQDALGRRILLENPSTYLEFTESTIPEWEFLARMAEESDCGLLLDANNVYVACYNHRYDTKAYIDAVPADRVVQIHLAGHDNKGSHIIDTHGGHVIGAVWNIYRYILSRTGPVATMVEWDANIPAFEVVYKEVQKAKKFAESRKAPNDLPSFEGAIPVIPPAARPLTKAMGTMMENILSNDTRAAKAWVRPKKDFPADRQLAVYSDGYRFRLFDTVAEDYPVLERYLGKKNFHALLDAFIEKTPSSEYNVARYSELLPDFLKGYTLPNGKEKRIAHEIAVLEAAHLKVFDAPRSAPFDASVLAELSPEAFLNLTLDLRAALSLHAFRYPVGAYFAAVKGEKKLPTLKARHEYVAVYREGSHLWILPLEQAEYDLLQALQRGKKLGAALEAVMQKHALSEDVMSERFQNWFAEWLKRELLAAPEKRAKKKAA